MVGTHIGTYILDAYLGEGGSGVVYRATHVTLGRVVAIKVYNRTLSPNTLRRSLQEAITLGKMRHPNIVTLFDYLEYEGAPCLVMEYVEGSTLQELLCAPDTLPLQQALPCYQTLVETVAYVHRQGIVHRDIKPNNIKITPEGVVKLLDFGIALAANGPRFTTERCVIGTDEYLAPELLEGASAQPASDVWALGILLYELMTRKKPFASTSLPDLYAKIQAARYAAPSTLNSHLPAGLEAIIARCLKRRPSERYSDASALLADLRQLSFGESGWRKRPDFRRFFWIPPVLLVGVVLLLFGMALLSPPPAVSPTPKSEAQPNSAGSIVPASGSGAVELNVLRGQADVYRPGESQPFAKTPYTFQAPIGQEVKLILRRPGYKDLEKPITISPNLQRFNEQMDPLPGTER